MAYPDPMADRLYTETKSYLESHVKSLLEQYVGLASEGLDQTENSILYKYYKAWKEYSQGLDYLNYLYA